jgi:uncharacterized protein (DUF2344 family)
MIERILRRTGGEFKMTEGFHQRMKLSFGQALPTGVIDRSGLFLLSTDEILDEEFLKVANSISPLGFEISKTEIVNDKFELGKSIDGYIFKLIFLRTPEVHDGWEIEEKGKIWVAGFFNVFNSHSPKPDEFGQYLTIRDSVIFKKS